MNSLYNIKNDISDACFRKKVAPMTDNGPLKEDSKVIQRAMDRRFIDQSVAFINSKANETLYKGSIEIGNFLLKHFFNDDITLATSKNPKKPKSFKALCKHKDLAVPYTTLTIMVRVAAQERFFMESGLDTEKLSYTHKSDLVRLENTPEKIEIAKACILKNFSTRELSRMVSDKRRKVLENKKHLKDESPFANISTIEQLLNKSMKSELVTDIGKLRGMHQKTRQDLKEKTAQLIESMLETTRECKKLIRNLDRVEKERGGS